MDDLWLTLNPATLGAAVVAGLILGYVAFMPLVRVLLGIDGDTPSDSTPGQAARLTFVVVFVVLAVVVVTFYVAQLGAEWTLGGFSLRAIGRIVTFLVYLLAMSGAVAAVVYRDTARHLRP